MFSYTVPYSLYVNLKICTLYIANGSTGNILPFLLRLYQPPLHLSSSCLHSSLAHQPTSVKDRMQSNRWRWVLFLSSVESISGDWHSILLSGADRKTGKIKNLVNVSKAQPWNTFMKPYFKHLPGSVNYQIPVALLRPTTYKPHYLRFLSYCLDPCPI